MTQILIIDDDLATRALLKRSLLRQGYEVFEAKDGLEGLEQAIHLKPALIICDWMMPKMDGLEVCRQVKVHPDLSTTFFILLTTRGATQDRVLGLDTGADDFLSKPIEIDELRARVRAGLRIHQLTQDFQTQNQALEQMADYLKLQTQILEKEFLEAADYVRSLLPSALKGLVNIDARFVPSQKLGGDCFDYYWLDPDYLAIYLLDVSGHGLGAALLSVAVLNLLRSQSLPGVNFYQPGHVLDGLNETFQMTDQNDKYFTIWYGVYNRARRQLVYASAGHPPAVLLTPQEGEVVPQVKLLKRPGVPIGMLPDMRFTTDRCDLEPNSTLYVFSDGIYEIKQANNEIWGLEAFTELLVKAETYSTKLDQILHQIYALNPKETLDDDLSLLRIRFK